MENVQMRRQRTEQKSLTTGYECNCNAKEITILFCKQIGQSPNTSYTKCRIGKGKGKWKWGGTAYYLDEGGRFCVGCLVNARMITALAEDKGSIQRVCGPVPTMIHSEV
jgi:hypothetical protein